MADCVLCCLVSASSSALNSYFCPLFSSVVALGTSGFLILSSIFVMLSVKLQGSDGVILDVDNVFINRSPLLKEMMDSTGPLRYNLTVYVLPKIESTTLRKVVEWVGHHKDDPMEPPDDVSIERLSQWDKDFFDMEPQLLLKVVEAANYFKMEDLKDTAARMVAKMFCGKTVEELRQMFNILNDLSSSDEEEYREEGNWVE